MRDHVIFLYGGERVAWRGPPTTTVLQWLRADRRRTGTKEGCAEGDCGACTVIVGRRRAGRVVWSPMNACIAFVPMLDRAVVWSIEDLFSGGEPLHPVQQAMVDRHGSQCGFCTPGFVMSMAALAIARGGAGVDRPRVDQWLGGNLCRCTGYGPIAAAAAEACSKAEPEAVAARRRRDEAAMADLADLPALDMTSDGGRFTAPSTVQDLAKAAATHPKATIVSGATDVGLWVTKQHRALPHLLWTGAIEDARFTTITRNDDTRVWIGAGATHAEAHAAALHPALDDLWLRFAGQQVRSTGTVGGNIANGSPIGDLAPALIALGATLHLRSGDEERALPLEDFFIAYGRQDRQPGEIVVGLTVALPQTASDFAVHKVSKRFDDDISAVCGAFHICVEHGVIRSARIAFGGIAATPKRALSVERALIGQPWTRATIDAALTAFAHDFEPIDDMRASAAYRLRVAQNLLVRTFIERTAPDVATRLSGTGAAFQGAAP
jgi:xanthine dehydrogenase small subunit